jgi:hypothetical protein
MECTMYIVQKKPTPEMTEPDNRQPSAGSREYYYSYYEYKYISSDVCSPPCPA